MILQVDPVLVGCVLVASSKSAVGRFGRRSHFERRSATIYGGYKLFGG